MAGYALGDILSGAMQGYDDQVQQDRLDRYYQDYFDNRALQRQRDVAADARAQTEFDNKQADRAHDLDRRPIKEAQEDSEYGLQAAIKQLQLRKDQHDVGRLPLRDQQQDQQFALEQQARRQQINLNSIKTRLDQMGLDDKKVEQSRQQAQDALTQGFAAGRMTGDWSHLADAYNSTIAQTHNGQPITVTQGQDGSFTVANGSGAMKFADQNHLFQALGAVVDPKLYMQDLYAGLTRKDQPAAIQETNAIFQRLPAQDGEDENARWMRAYAMRSEKAGESPSDSAAGFYKTMVKEGGLKPDKAMEATRTFMSQFYPNAKGPWNGGSQQRQVQPVFADPGNGAAPPPRFAQAPGMQRAPTPTRQPQERPRIVRYGRRRDGTRVAQLEDGTVVPVQ